MKNRKYILTSFEGFGQFVYDFDTTLTGITKKYNQKVKEIKDSTSFDDFDKREAIADLNIYKLVK